MLSKFKFFVSAAALLVAVGAMSVFAQGDPQTRTVPAGQKLKINGVVVKKQGEVVTLREMTGVETNVVIGANTSIKTKATFGGERVPASSIVRGLTMEVEGIGDGQNLVASKVRFNKSDLRTATAIDSRVSPAEERISQSEQNAERLSGQIDELMAISNAARGGAKAAQDTADAAVAGVNATNQRITALDDYVVQSTATVNFKVGSSVLSPEGKEQLDQLATLAQTLKGYQIEVTGFADASGSPQKNKVLSERRARAVLDYLIETHNIPLRRIGMSYGFGESQAVADNATREGRAQNRRVEVKVLVSRGLNQNVEVKKAEEAAPEKDNQ